MWGEEETDYGDFDNEPFYDPDKDPGIDLRKWFHLDSWRAISPSRRAVSDNWVNSVNYLDENNDPVEVETIIMPGKWPKGSKLKKKIVYVYDSDSDEED